jgi:hypothetical protein
VWLGRQQGMQQQWEEMACMYRRNEWGKRRSTEKETLVLRGIVAESVLNRSGNPSIGLTVGRESPALRLLEIMAEGIQVAGHDVAGNRDYQVLDMPAMIPISFSSLFRF